MNNEFIYLIAEKLYSNASTHELCNRNWLFAIYKSLLVANKQDDKPIVWTKYDQWQVDHNCRASKSTAVLNKTELVRYTIHLINKDQAEIKCVFNKNGETKEETCLYSREAFVSALWEVRNPEGETILMSPYERDELYESSLDPLDITEVKVDEAEPQVSIEPDEEPLTNNDQKEHARRMKFVALKKLLDQIRETYNAMEDSQQRSYIEVVVGAAIFYLPSHHSHFSGYISIDALKGYKSKNRMVKDHIYPRKHAARELLRTALSLEELIKKYHEELSQFMYVTPRENLMLVNYYEEHESHDDALVAFQIGKFPATATEKFTSHKELMTFISFIESKRVESASMETLMDWLRAFRNNETE